MIEFKALPQTLWRVGLQYWRKLWVRVAIMGAFGLIALGLAEIAVILVPREIGSTLTGQAVDRLLNIIANAMLAVTTFSLTVMVTVYRSSSSQFTPRVHRLIMEDTVTQNTLATFIGAYVYALVAIILRELRVFSDDRALVLFITTVIVLGFITFSLIRWTLHLQTMGSLLDTSRQVETRTRENFQERLDTPCLGGNAWDGAVPDGAETIRAAESGYVRHIYPESLDAFARSLGKAIYLPRGPGSFVFLNEPLAYVIDEGEPDAEEAGDIERDLKQIIHDHVVLGDLRTYDQDPRFGLMVMGEIASKALSPGINDPGTAIDVITRSARILSCYKDERDGDVTHARLHIPPLDPDDLMDDAFGALARDGRAVIEVQLRLQKAFAALRQHPDAGLARAAFRAAVTEYRRAQAALDFDVDRERLRASTGDDVVARAQEKSRKATPEVA